MGFHSISFPSEWGVAYANALGLDVLQKGFHSISFPSEWGVISTLLTSSRLASARFHSISFPSEWGVLKSALQKLQNIYLVSIQLVSPASGEFDQVTILRYWGWGSFHSISFPSEWGAIPLSTKPRSLARCFHSISFPSEWGV